MSAAQRTEGLYGYFASSVMLLDCAKLRHWRCEEQFNELFEFKRDYMDWVSLKLEPRETIGLLEKEWNDFDRLTAATKMLHNTRRITQPWKTGLPIDFEPPDAFKPISMYAWLMRFWPALFRQQSAHRALLATSRPEPGEAVLRAVARVHGARRHFRRVAAPRNGRNHVRHDARELLERTTPLAA